MPYADPNEGSTFRRGSQRRAYQSAALNMLKGFQGGYKEAKDSYRENALNKLRYGGETTYQGKPAQQVGMEYLDPWSKSGGQTNLNERGEPVATGFGKRPGVQMVEMQSQTALQKMMANNDVRMKISESLNRSRERMAAGRGSQDVNDILKVWTPAYSRSANSDAMLMNPEGYDQQARDDADAAVVAFFLSKSTTPTAPGRNPVPAQTPALSTLPKQIVPREVPLNNPEQDKEGDTAIGPGGQRIIFRNGQWIPFR